MKKNELFNMKNSVIIGSGIDIKPYIRELILLGRQFGYEIYVHYDLEHKDDVNIELKELLKEYGFDYEICPEWVYNLVDEPLANGDIVIFKDNKYMKKLQSDDMRCLFNILVKDNLVVNGEKLFEDRILEDSISKEVPYILNNSNNDHGVRNFVKRKYKIRKNR